MAVNRVARSGGFADVGKQLWAQIATNCGPRLTVTFPAQDLDVRKVGARKLHLYQVKGGYIGIPESSSGDMCRYKLLLRNNSTDDWNRDVIDLSSSLAFLCADGWESDPSKRVPVSGAEKANMLETIQAVLMSKAIGARLSDGIEVEEKKELGLAPSNEPWFSYQENGEAGKWTFQTASQDDKFRDSLSLASVVNCDFLLMEHMLWMGLTPLIDMDMFVRTTPWFQRARLGPVIFDNKTEEIGYEQALIAGVPSYFMLAMARVGLTFRRDYTKTTKRTKTSTTTKPAAKAVAKKVEKPVEKKATVKKAAAKKATKSTAKTTTKRSSKKTSEVVAEAKAVAKKAEEKIVAKKKAPAKSRAKKVAG